jgi:OFA family oxalate/formate antiporter-like MFS transporter
MMFLGHLLLKKPSDWVEVPVQKKKGENILDIFKNKTFIGIWLMFFINITCGLALISQEKDLLHFIGFGAVGVISSLTALFNASGRLGFASFGDRLKDRNTIYIWIFGLSIAATTLTLLANGINNAIAPLVIITLCVINAGYGGGFSSLPPLLADRFGMNSISTIHGLALSAWAFAGLSGNQLSAFIIAKTDSYNNVLYVVLALYTVALLISAVILRSKPDKMNKTRHPA